MSDQPGSRNPSGKPKTEGRWFVPGDVAAPAPKPAATNVAMPTNDAPQKTGGWFVPPEVKAAQAHAAAAEPAEPFEAAPAPETPVESSTPEPAAPVAEATPEPASNEGGAVRSDQIDYSKYVPGRGVVEGDAPVPEQAVPEQATSSAPAAEATLQPTGIQPSINEPIPTATGGTSRSMMTPVPAANPVFKPSASQTSGTPNVTNAQLVAQLATPATSDTLTQRFTDVEQQVQVLRRKYTAGTLSGDQLRSELRKLMILDSTGSWWMIGMESDRWYKYNGNDWIQGTPPGRAPDPVDAAPQVTGTAGVVTPADLPPTSTPNIPLDEFGMPLPQRVPIQDMGATMVGRSAPYLDNTLRTPRDTSSDYQDSAGDLTVPGAAVSGATVPGAAVRYSAADAATVGSAVAADAANGATIPSPAATYTPGEQPNYGEKPTDVAADRTRLTGCVVRGALVAVFLTLIVALIGIVGSVLGYYSIVNQYDAAIAALPQAASNTFQTTHILDSAGNVLAEINDPNGGKRQIVRLGDISPFLIHATISTEDPRFYENPGFDVISIIRAVLQNTRAGETVSGASTITQQLARALVFDPNTVSQSRSGRKLIEIIVSSEISRRYSKDQILEMYLNQIPYGNFSYGIEAASQTYFNKHAKDLNLAESSFLAGLPQAPATYDPVQNREAAFGRMADVLRLMVRTGCLQMQHAPYNKAPVCVSQADIDTAVVLIAQVKAHTYNPPSNTYNHPHFVNYILQELETKYGTGAIYKLGFNVYTTLDPNMQATAEQAVAAQMKALASRHVTNGAVLAVRPSDGAILAMVGSADFNNAAISGQVNIVLAARQPGSTLKPFIYAGTFERAPDNNYWTPATIIWDVPGPIGGAQFRNYDGQFHGPQTVRNSLGNSLNIPAVKALQYLTLERFKSMAERVGLKFPLSQPDAAGLTTALGATEVRLYDLTKAYALFANQGKRLDDLYAISRITKTTDGKEQVVYDAKNNPIPQPQEMEPGIAYLVTSMLSDPQARRLEFGLNTPLDLPGGRPAAVKTGTTNDSRDNWTVGYTPDLVVGVWVGNADNSPMIGTNGIMGAAPIWNQVMTTALNGKPVQQFPAPQTVGPITICADYGSADFADCPAASRKQEMFFAPNPPIPAEQIVKVLKVDQFSGLVANQYCPDYTTTKVYMANLDETALNWLNTTGAGQAWATAHKLTIPVTPAPTQQCDQTTPRPVVKITNPQQGQTVSGLIQVMGSVNVPNFSRYQLELAQSARPDVTAKLGDPIRSQPTADNSFLSGWDTNNVPDGQYNLRLTAYDSQEHSITLIVPVIVNNTTPAQQPQPQIQPTQAIGVTVPTAIPGFPTFPPPNVPTSTSVVQSPVIVPGAAPTRKPIFPPTSTPRR